MISSKDFKKTVVYCYNCEERHEIWMETIHAKNNPSWFEQYKKSKYRFCTYCNMIAKFELIAYDS